MPVRGLVNRVANFRVVRTGPDTIFAVPRRQHLRDRRKASSLVVLVSGAHASDSQTANTSDKVEKHGNIPKLT
jgi:hypothetical protein